MQAKEGLLEQFRDVLVAKGYPQDEVDDLVEAGKHCSDSLLEVCISIAGRTSDGD